LCSAHGEFMRYYSKQDAYAKKVKSQYRTAITCEYTDCPLFNTCPQMTFGGQLFGSKKAKIFFVFDSPDQDDVRYDFPAISTSGLYFREYWLELFLGEVGPVPHLLTYLVRSPLEDKSGSSRAATQTESAYCWEHFYKELMKHRPEVIVGFGGNIFNQIYKNAKNKEKLPPPESHAINKLRLAAMDVQLANDYTPKVFIGYDPSFFLKSPASAAYFIEDRDRVINHFCPNKKDLSKASISIDKIDLIETVDDALTFIDFLTRGLPKNEGLFDLAFDTETENLNLVYNNKFLSWQFTYKEGHAVFIPIDHPERPIFADVRDKMRLIEAFQKLLNSTPEKTRIRWIVAHNAKFDFGVLYGLYKILPRGTIPIWDTLLGMHWLDENRKGMSAVLDGKPYSLKTIGQELFGFKYKNEQLAARAEGDLVSLSFRDLVEYGGTDTILTWHLKHEQMRKAKEQPDHADIKLDRFMRHYYSPATRAVAVMECNGLYTSKKQLQYLQGMESPIWNRIEKITNIYLQGSPEVKAFRQEFSRLLQGEANIDYEEDLWGDSGTEDVLPVFNQNKKDQETAFYLDFLKLEPLAFSKKTKKPTLNKDFLQHYAEPEVYLELPTIKPYLEHYKTPINKDDEEPVFPKNPLQLILEYRELSKLGNTYLSNIAKMVADPKGDSIDKRVRASYWLSGTDTGRLCLRYDSRISVLGDCANVAPPIEPSKLGIPIKDVKVDDLVYCYDDDGNLQIKKVLWQGKTGTKKLLRIYWRAGNRKKKGYLDVTPEHRVRLLDGSYKMAKDLRPNDRLLSLARNVIKTNKNKANYYSTLYTSYNICKEHRFIYECLTNTKPDIVHHEDGNSLNNHPSNLKATSRSGHTSDHLYEHWRSGVFDNRGTKGAGHYLWNHQGKFTFLKELAKVKGSRKSPEGLANKNLIKNSASFKKRCQMFGIDPKVVKMRYDGYGCYISKGRLQKLLMTTSANTVALDLKIDYRTLKALVSFYGQEHLISNRKRSDQSKRKHTTLRNHIVVRVEELPGTYDVYDLEIEDCHNFIANEICVHNSSSNPNLQNLPSGRSKMAKEVKNLFVAEPPSKRWPEGTVLIQLDYKTAEVRWAAIFANDTNLIRLFNEAHDSLVKACSPNSNMTEEEFKITQLASDIHRRTASLMYGVEPAKVSKEQRQVSKSITFGLLFGMGVQTLAKNNGWSENEAEEKVEKFFSAFPQLRHYLEGTSKQAQSQGYLETFMGRRRRLDYLYKVNNFKFTAKANRLAKNAPIQGQSSDGGVVGLIQFLQYLLDNNLERRWLIQNVVHDSCLVQVPMLDLEKALYAMQHCFVQGMADYIKQHFGFTLPLPIECEIEVGLLYGDLTKWDGRPSTLPALIEKIKNDAHKLWYAKEVVDKDKPCEDLDLVKWYKK